MGWMNRKSHPVKPETPIAVKVDWGNREADSSPSVAFIEDTNDPTSYKQVPITTSNDELPFIEASIVIAAVKADLLWVIIDDIVYDCTLFVKEHPGGAGILESFRSSNCSWQFWRFHDEKVLIEFGKPLRIGRTAGIQNRFKEPPRFVGLRKPWCLND
jgi:cytochrome b involved in lipid metabolism